MNLDLIKYLYEERKFISAYLLELMKLGYIHSEYQILVGQLNFIDEWISKLNFTNLKNLLFECSNRRLKQIISGESLIVDIINIPDDYKLIIDIDNIEDIDTSNSLVFKSVNKKYCIFTHKNFTKQGLNYIQGKWQSL